MGDGRLFRKLFSLVSPLIIYFAVTDDYTLPVFPVPLRQSCLQQAARVLLPSACQLSTPASVEQCWNEMLKSSYASVHEEIKTVLKISHSTVAI